ncbi:hypothetical protein GQ53DRAFT_739310 [Thozetella sp. PMI_491]|nr:hypothetical protein GQ53DRAFT_739310 [Thozetella sp. PMI_491]
MRFSVLVSLVSAVVAFQIPTGTTDGVYEVSYAEDGSEIHTRISDVNITKRAFAIRSATAEKRTGSGVVTCLGFEGNLNPNDNGAAATALANQCGPGAAVGSGRDFYSIVGCSVAYFCNLKDHTQVCSSVGAWQSFNDINNICGANIPGYELYYDSDGRDQYGYEWFCTSPGNKFCNRGTNGKRTLD